MLAVDERITFVVDDVSERSPVGITSTRSFRTPSFTRTVRTWKLITRDKSCWDQLTCSQVGGFLTTNLGILSITGLFCYTVPPNICPLFTNKTASTRTLPKTIVSIVAVVLAATSLLLLWLTHFTDPGVLRRRDKFPIRALRPGERICSTCNIIKARLTKHCRHCDHCVEVFDHHCVYAGACVGDGNYLFFFLLLISALLSAIHIGVFSTFFVIRIWSRGKPRDSRMQFLLSIAMFLLLLSFSIGFLISRLCAYHVIIVVSGDTTNERIKRQRAQRRLEEPLLFEDQTDATGTNHYFDES